MNCTRFRYLIQKNFDTDLTKQDENALLKHLDSCDSCGKFNHQIQQVIIGTNDLNLPKSILPQSPEAICKKIIQDLPKPKSNLVILIESIIAKFKKAPESKKLTNHSQESHEQILTKPKNSKEKTQEIEEEHLAQTSRLRSLGKAVSDLVVESRESQSTTKSLGQKLKINTGNALTQEERPLTAAELIRLKVAENQRNAHEAENHIIEEPKKAVKLDNGNYVNQNVSTNPIDMGNSSNQPTFKSTGNSQSEDQMIVEPILGGWGNTAPMPHKPALWEDEEANAQIDSDALTSWNSPQNEPKTIPQDAVSKKTTSQATGWETQSSEWLATNSFESNVIQEPVHSNNQSGWSSPNLVSNPNVKQQNNDIKNIWGANTQSDTNKSSNKVSDSQSVAAWGSPTPNQAVSDNQSIAVWGAATSSSPISNPVAPVQPINDSVLPSQDVAVWGSPEPIAPANTVPPSPASNESAFSAQPGISAWEAPAPIAPANTAPPNQASHESAFGSQQGVSAWGVPQPIAPTITAPPNQASHESAFGSQQGVSAWGAPQPIAPTITAPPNQASHESAFGSQQGVSAWGAPQPTTPANTAPPNQASHESAFGSQQGVSAWGAPQPTTPANSMPPNQPNSPSAFGSQPGISGWGAPQPTTPANAIPTSPEFNNGFNPENFATNSNNSSVDFNQPWNNANNFPQENGVNNDIFDTSNKPTESSSPKKPVLNRRNVIIPEEQISTGNWKAFTPNQNALGAINKTTERVSQTNPSLKGENPFENEKSNNQSQLNQPIQTANPIANSQPVNNQSPFNQPIQSTNPIANSQPVNNQSPFNQPIQTTNTISNNQPVNNQSPFNQPIQTTNPIANSQPVNNQLPFNQPIQTTNAIPNNQPVNNQLPFNQPNQPIHNTNSITSSPSDNSSSGLLGQISDSDMDKIFSENLGLKENSSFTTAPVQNNFSNPIPPMSAINQLENRPGSNITKLNSPKSESGSNNTSDKTQSGLFNLNDDDIDKIFSENLGFKENSSFTTAPVQNNISNPIAPMPPVNLPEYKPEPSTNTLNSSIAEVNLNTTSATAPTGLFNLNDDDMDKLFAVNLGINTELKPILPQSNPVQSTNQQQSNPNQPVFDQQQSNPNQPVYNQQQSNPNQPVFDQQQSNPNQPVYNQQQSNPNQPVYNQQQSNSDNKRISTSPQASQTNLFSFNQQMINNLYTNENSDNSIANQQTEHNITSPQLTPVNLNPMNYPTPKIYGIGRLDTKNEVSSETGSGRISNIGNFLLDQKDKEGLKNLMNNNINELNTRILTEDTSNNLKKMLEHIQTQAQVIGSVLVGMDGFLYSNTLPREIDAESFGVWALGIFMNTSNVVKQLQFNKVKHIISKTQLGYLIIADCKDVILVTVSNGSDTSTLMPLMKTITNLLPK